MFVLLYMDVQNAVSHPTDFSSWFALSGIVIYTGRNYNIVFSHLYTVARELNNTAFLQCALPALSWENLLNHNRARPWVPEFTHVRVSLSILIYHAKLSAFWRANFSQSIHWTALISNTDSVSGMIAVIIWQPEWYHWQHTPSLASKEISLKNSQLWTYQEPAFSIYFFRSVLRGRLCNLEKIFSRRSTRSLVKLKKI